MQAKIYTDDNAIGIRLTPLKYRRSDRYVGTAIIQDAVISNGEITGELLGEYLDEIPFTNAALPGPLMKRFKPLTDSVSQAKIVYAAGKDFYYLP